MARELQVSFSIEGRKALRVTRFELVHDAAQPGLFEVEFVLDDPLPPGALIGRGAMLSFGHDGEAPRQVSGIVESVTVMGSHAEGHEDRGARYAMRVVEPRALLERSIGSQIFQNESVPDIVTKVLREHGIDKVALRLSGSYPRREYCVQYQESALAFISRLLEHEGIFAFTEQGDEGEVLVLADDSMAAAPLDPAAALPLRKRTQLGEAGDAIYAFCEQRAVRSGKFVLRDYDFERPRLDLTAFAEAEEHADLEVYDYPGAYVDPEEGPRLARLRLEAELVERFAIEIEAVCARLAVGHKIAVEGAGDLDGEYFAFEVTHAYEHSEGQPRYGARARLVPLRVPYRPACVTTRPVIEGPQTAVVVAPAGSPSETIHTDAFGRCKVRFWWDRSGIGDDRASCWMRVAQPQTSGSMMLARIGWEVLVEFLEGDPDRPIVTALLYNGAMMPPYALPEGRTRTAIRTVSTPGGGGINELRFEDKAGAEEIMMRAQRDMVVAVSNNAKRSIGNNETRVVGNNASLAVGGHQTTKITKGAQNTIGGSQTIAIGGERSAEVNAVAALNAEGAADVTVGGNQLEMDGNPLEALLALAAERGTALATAMVDNEIKAVQGEVDGAIDQVMKPVNDLNTQIKGFQKSFDSLRAGKLSAIGDLVSGALSLPGPGQLASSFAGESPALLGRTLGPNVRPTGKGPESPTNALAEIARKASHGVIKGGVEMAQKALAGALGKDGDGGGGASGANVGGPSGDVAPVDATDREKGPGHSIAKIGGGYEETVGAVKIMAVTQSVDTSVAGSKTLSVGAATVQFAAGKYAESVAGSKTESALGLVVLSKGGESEKVGATKTAIVGGAVVDKLKGGHTITATGPATFIGAFHKVDAATSIVLKCGASEVVIDESGVSITAPVVSILAPKIQLPKKVSEV